MSISKYKTYKNDGVGTYVKCYESHPALVIGDYKIYGGSCIRPVITDADVYVGFDIGMHISHLTYPWETGESFLFHIPDMKTPSNPEQFKKLIDWLSLQLISNKKVHLGCIGGHGRSGLALAALVKVMTGEVDAITYVRENYCHKAVESSVQVEFLHIHFGIKKVKEVKNHFETFDYTMPYRSSGGVVAINKKQDKLVEPKTNFVALSVSSKLCVFGPEIEWVDKFDKTI